MEVLLNGEDFDVQAKIDYLLAVVWAILDHTTEALSRALYEWWEIEFFTLTSTDIRGMVLAIKYDMSKQCAYAWDGVGDFSCESCIRELLQP